MDQVFDRYMTALTQVERLPEPHLLRYQHGLVERLVRHARGHVPFYRDRLQSVFGPDDAFDFTRWPEVPVLERPDAALAGARLRAPELPESYGAIHEITTSGTTGVPLNFTFNELVSTAGNGALTLLARWHGMDTSRTLAIIRMYPAKHIPPMPEGIHSKGWSQASPDADSFGIDMRTPLDQQLEWLENRKAPYLITSASHATAIAYAAGADRSRALGLEFVLSTAETVLPRARNVVKERFGAKLVALYSCQEIGTIAMECPVSGQYHVVMDNALVEIVRPDGSPVAPGETGRVLVTGLYNYATPFIRYAIGDVATAATGACPCGRSLPLIAQIEGRTRAEFIFRDGTRMWPRLLHAEAIRAFVPFREFQMVQMDHDVIEFRYIAQPDAPSPDLAGLQRYGREKFHRSVDILAVSVEELPRSRSGKHEHFISLVAPSG